MNILNRVMIEIYESGELDIISDMEKDEDATGIKRRKNRTPLDENYHLLKDAKGWKFLLRFRDGSKS